MIYVYMFFPWNTSVGVGLKFKALKATGLAGQVSVMSAFQETPPRYPK
jgi:hypothetical protein